MTKETLLQTIKTWCNGPGMSKIEKYLLSPEQISEEIFSYIYIDGNNIVPSSDKGKQNLQQVMEIYQGLPHHTRNWVAFRIRPETLFMDTDSEIMDKVITISKKYLDMRCKKLASQLES